MLRPPNARPALVGGVAATLLVVALAGGAGTAAAETPVTECREINDSVVGADRTAVLQNNVSGGGAECLSVTADDVTLDGNGHTVGGPDGGTGIAVKADGVTVTNATVETFETGVRVAGRNATLTDLTVTNGTTGVQFGTDGAPASGSVDATAANNSRGVHVVNTTAGGVRVDGAEAENNTGAGVLVEGGGGQVAVVNARIADNGGAGVNVTGRDRVLVQTSNFLRNDPGAVVADSRNVTLRGNEFFRSDSAAVSLRGGRADANHTVVSNEIDRPDDHGVALRTGGVAVRNNSVTDANASAIRVTGSAPGARLSDNTVDGGPAGLVVEAPNTTVVGDTYTGAETGARVAGAANTTIVGGRVAKNTIGIDATRAAGTTVRGTEIVANDLFGVSFRNATGVVLDDVTVARNGGGVSLGARSSAEVTEDVVIRDSRVVDSRAPPSSVGGVGRNPSAGPGIISTGASDVLVARTNLSANGFAGFVGLAADDLTGPGSGSNVTLDGVTADQNQIYGVAVEGGDGVTLANATVAGNGDFGVVAIGATNTTVRAATVRDNAAGLYVDEDVRVVGTTAANNDASAAGQGRFFGQSGYAPVDVRAEGEVSVESLTVGNATLSGTLGNVSLTGVAPPAGPPGDRIRLGGNVDVEPRSAAAAPYADVRVSYADTEAAPADEDDASLYRYTGVEWVPVANSTPDPSANTVGGNVTAFSNVSAFADPDDPPVANLSASVSGQTVGFDATNSTDPDSAIESYEWDFDGDGRIDATTTEATTTHSYVRDGSYDAVVRVVSNGLNDTATVTASIDTESDGGNTEDPGTDVSITSVEADRKELRVGDTVRVTARLRNEGIVDDTVELRLAVDGERADSRALTLRAGETRTVTIEREFDAEGEYSLSVNGQSLGTVRVLGATGATTPTATPDGTPTGTPSVTGTPTTTADAAPAETPATGEGPGFGVVAALAALAVLAALARRS